MMNAMMDMMGGMNPMMNPMGMAAMGMAMMSAAKGMKDEDSEEESADEKEESKGAVPGPGPVPEATSQDVTKELLNIDEGAFLRVNYTHPQLGRTSSCLVAEDVAMDRERKRPPVAVWSENHAGLIIKNGDLT